MRKFNVLTIAVAATLVLGVAAFAELTAESLKEAKCPVSQQDVSKEAHLKWKEGEVHFCCDKCQAQFEKDSDKLAAKANHQLVVTKQYEQKACPISGGAIKKDMSVKVGGTTVSFCCNGCKGKAEKMDEEAKVAELFSNKAFEKAKFVKVEASKE